MSLVLPIASVALEPSGSRRPSDGRLAWPTVCHCRAWCRVRGSSRVVSGWNRRLIAAPRQDTDMSTRRNATATDTGHSAPARGSEKISTLPPRRMRSSSQFFAVLRSSSQLFAALLDGEVRRPERVRQSPTLHREIAEP
jgi:hypothetical protein